MIMNFEPIKENWFQNDNWFIFADADWEKRHKKFHDNYDKIHQSNDEKDGKTFKWPKNNTFLGDKHDITPDPVDQNGHKLLVGIVEPSSRKDRWAGDSIKEVD